MQIDKSIEEICLTVPKENKIIVPNNSYRCKDCGK